ncbi:MULTISPECIES: YCF48-related protein [unclassified Empedobacter]|uniref:YCF48-related protein n=1 Tax=unclassified Empedobacter TaxID=2643773 RepID=UPI0025C49A56|nr:MULTISPECIES: YCF48-related protein [unclassified Empedobacter]
MKYFVLLLSSLSFAQTYQVINEENTSVSYRGLAFQDAKTFIVSGSKNTIGKTTDGGKTFSWINPKVVENRDFRDVEILGKDNYLALGIDSPAYILQTKDGGKSWNKVYENNEKGIFLDAIYVDKTSKKITVLGDPMSPDKPFVLTSSITDPTKWEVAKSLHGQPLRLKNPKEAFFASSGSNLYVDAKQTLIVTGGELSNLYYYTPKGGQMYALEKTKSSTSGINGMAYDATNNVGYLVGGDFTKPENSSFNFYKFKLLNGKITFQDSWKYPAGYKSGVTIISKDKVLVCGYSGVDYSADGGHNWTNLTQDSYNTCTVSPDKKYVILVGNKGKIGKITL